MPKLITGLHHITALASDPQKNCDFYAGILGLRLVKKSVNQDVTNVFTSIMAMREDRRERS